MLSSGGLFNATSFEISPVVLAADVALELAALPKRPDIVEVEDLKKELKEGRNRWEGESQRPCAASMVF